MGRILGLVSVLMGFSTAANALATLTVFTTDLSNVPKDTFLVGETILLKVTGDSGVDPSTDTQESIGGELLYNGAITDTLGATQGSWLHLHNDNLIVSEGDTFAFIQVGQTTNQNQIDTSVITLLATAPGVSQVTWGGTLLDFFGIYVYDNGAPISVPTGHSFTITPEPATIALIGVGLVALATRRRARAR